MDEIKNFVHSFNADLDGGNNMPYAVSDDICNSPITVEEIITHRKLKNNKADGADGISGELLKYVSDDLHSEKSPARPMLFYSTNYWHQFCVQFVV